MGIGKHDRNLAPTLTFQQVLDKAMPNLVRKAYLAVYYLARGEADGLALGHQDGTAGDRQTNMKPKSPMGAKPKGWLGKVFDKCKADYEQRYDPAYKQNFKAAVSGRKKPATGPVENKDDRRSISDRHAIDADIAPSGHRATGVVGPVPPRHVCRRLRRDQQSARRSGRAAARDGSSRGGNGISRLLRRRLDDVPGWVVTSSDELATRTSIPMSWATTPAKPKSGGLLGRHKRDRDITESEVVHIEDKCNGED